MKRIFILLLLPLLMSACDMFEYHPYDGRIKGEKDINNKNIARIEKSLEGKKDFKFAFLGDTQRWYDDTVDFVNDINSQDDIDFVVHGGDLSDFGLTKEFMWQRDILNKLKVPYIVIIGNHDCLANGEEVFQKIFGDTNFSFIAGNVRFVCLNTNALELDYSTPVPDFEFIEQCLISDEGKYEKTVFAMHARPYSEQFNNNVAKIFQQEIKKFPELLFCLNGHDHQEQIDDLFDDGIIYYGTPNIHKRKYFTFTITEHKHEHAVIAF